MRGDTGGYYRFAPKFREDRTTMATHPLIDLHRHPEGPIRSSTFLDVARRDGHPLADPGRP